MARESESASTREVLAELEHHLIDGTVAALITHIDGPGAIGAKLLVNEQGQSTGTLASEHLETKAVERASTFLRSKHEAETVSFVEILPGQNTEVRLLFERIAPEPRLIVCGAGHVGASLARLGPGLGFRTKLVDDRIELLRPESFAEPRLVLVKIDGWASGVRDAVGNGRGAYVAIVTRGHHEDEECLAAVLAAKPDYVGMIGSRRRTNIVLDRLRAAGFADEVLREVRAPIGLAIGAVTPEEVALAIMAEMVSERRSGKGGSLSAWRRTDSSTDS
jgi:xanthine dehydrogenase accessory factor